MPYALCSTLIFFCLFSTEAYARREVESSERTRLLKTATGSSGAASASSFQARVDAIFDPASDPPTRAVASEDTQALGAFFSVPPEEVPATFVAPEQGPKDAVKDPLAPEDDEDKEAPPKPGGPVKTRVDAGEAAHRKELQKIYHELDLGAARRVASLETTAETEETPAPGPGLRLSLAHNPFYFAPESPDAFDKMRPVIVGRLLREGYSERDAAQIVSGAASAEEVILHLMREEGYTYGDAGDLVRT